MLDVLIVEDEPYIRSSLEKLLPWNNEGCRVIAAVANGEEAVRLLGMRNIDIVVSDIKMDNGDGFHVANAVSRLDPPPQLIFLTGHAEFDYARNAVQVGAAAFLLKPTDPEELLQAIRKARTVIEAEREHRTAVENLIKTRNRSVPDFMPLIELIRLGDIAGSGEYLESILSTIHDGWGTDVEFVHNTVVGISALVLQLLQEKAVEIPLPLRSPALFDRIAGASTASEVCEVARHLIAFAAESVASESTQAGDSLISRVRTYLEQHYAEAISLESLGAAVFKSPKYLSRVIRQHTGVTFCDMLLEIRISHAERLLPDSRLSIGEVALRVGIPDSQYFSRIFKKATGSTPSEFRMKETTTF